MWILAPHIQRATILGRAGHRAASFDDGHVARLWTRRPRRPLGPCAHADDCAFVVTRHWRRYIHVHCNVAIYSQIKTNQLVVVKIGIFVLPYRCW
jgi:hypothetical protein